MNLPEKAYVAFREIYEKKFGKKISEKEAKLRLCNIFSVNSVSTIRMNRHIN